MSTSRCRQHAFDPDGRYVHSGSYALRRSRASDIESPKCAICRYLAARTSIAVEMIGHTLVVVHGARHPSDADWEIYLDALRRNLEHLDAQLIVTDGGSPTSAQRRASLDLAAGRAVPPTAVVTSSVLARGAVAALSWFMKDKIRAFPHSEFDEACTFIGRAADRDILREAATRLRATLT